MAGKVIMIASGKGGTGKSTVCVFLGAELAARGNRVLLIELDSGLRSVDIIAGVYGKTVYDIEDVMRGRCDADKAVVESPIYKGLSVISAPYSGGAIDTSALKIITNKLGEVFDIILIDTAAGMGAPFEA
ncbi:MAG: AAA family ATPase, partial [Oscillospiraceae bacterium]